MAVAVAMAMAMAVAVTAVAAGLAGPSPEHRFKGSFPSWDSRRDLLLALEECEYLLQISSVQKHCMKVRTAQAW